MSTSSRIAGPLLASIFVHGGLDAYRNPESKVKAAEVVTAPITARIEALPEDTATLVKMNGAVQVSAGALLAIGKFRRLAAVMLIGSIIPTTYAGHRFWEEVDDEKKAAQQAHFLKNLGILGGLVMMATERPTPRRRRKLRSTLRNDASKVADMAERLVESGTELTGRLVESGTELTGNLITRAGEFLPTS